MADERKYGSVVTEAGSALILNSMMEDLQKINLTEIACGEGDEQQEGYYEPSANMTELKSEIWRGDIKSVDVRKESPNMLIITGVIPADVGGFTVREVAAFTDDGVMFVVCNTPDIQKVAISSGAVGEVELIIRAQISSRFVDNITFKVNPYVVTATKKNIIEHDESEVAHQKLFGGKADRLVVENHVNDVGVHVNSVTMGSYDRAVEEVNNHVENMGMHVNVVTMEPYDIAVEKLDNHVEDVGMHVNVVTMEPYDVAVEKLDNHVEDVGMHVNVVTMEPYDVAVEKLDNHVEDMEMHVNEVTMGAYDVAIEEFNNRINRLEDALFNNITGNPFMISFDSLEGVELVKGIWNIERRRIEC